MKRYIITRYILAAFVSLTAITVNVNASTTFIMDPSYDVDLSEGGYEGEATLETFATNNDVQGIQSQTLTSAVPEPATWLMLVIGFAFIGLATRRKRKIIHHYS